MNLYVIPEDFDQEDRTAFLTGQTIQHYKTDESDQDELGQEESGYTELCFE